MPSVITTLSGDLIKPVHDLMEVETLDDLYKYSSQLLETVVLYEQQSNDES